MSPSRRPQPVGLDERTEAKLLAAKYSVDKFGARRSGGNGWSHRQHRNGQHLADSFAGLSDADLSKELAHSQKAMVLIVKVFAEKIRRSIPPDDDGGFLLISCLRQQERSSKVNRQLIVVFWGNRLLKLFTKSTV
ncbi:unnamed protein product [Protopolystoma xenopodis]|uniref:Uncharacterized protein n=1 Tax=Protopolystoma xenopodis TaxID=117903 RepID=A0A3S5CNM1_9PLAT|nr:unnamed protein product [Protopolystoma xenopodis]